MSEFSSKTAVYFSVCGGAVIVVNNAAVLNATAPASTVLDSGSGALKLRSPLNQTMQMNGYLKIEYH